LFFFTGTQKVSFVSAGSFISLFSFVTDLNYGKKQNCVLVSWRSLPRRFFWLFENYVDKTQFFYNQTNRLSFFFISAKKGALFFVLTATLIKKKKKRVPKTTVLITIYTFPLAAATARSAPGQQKNPNETDLLELCTSFFFCLIWSRLLYSR